MALEPDGEYDDDNSNRVRVVAAVFVREPATAMVAAITAASDDITREVYKRVTGFGSLGQGKC